MMVVGDYNPDELKFTEPSNEKSSMPLALDSITESTSEDRISSKRTMKF